MSDYTDIIRKPETLNWFKAAMGINITRDCLLDIVKQATQELYHAIRKEINRKHSIPENVVCSQCNTQNVLPCNTDNQCCHYKNRKCTFHEIHMPRNCPSNNLCNEICKEIVDHHRFRNRSKTNSFRGPTWVNTDACQWCVDPWQIAKVYLSKEGYNDVNKAEEADFNGIVNVIYNCEFFQTYITDNLTQQKNVCTEARGVRHAVCHSSSMSMTRQESDRAIDALVALLKSLKHVNHQAAAKAAFDRLTQLKNGTLAITSEDVAATFELLKGNLIEKINEALEKEKDKLVKEMVDALNENICKARDDALKTIQRKGDDVLEITEACVGVLTVQTVRGKQAIESDVMDGNEAIMSAIEAGAGELNAHVLRGTENIVSAEMDGSDTIISAIEAGAGELNAHVRRGTEHIISAEMDGSDTIISAIEDGVRELKATVVRGTEDINAVVKVGSDFINGLIDSSLREFSAQVDSSKREIRYCKTQKDDEDKDSQCKNGRHFLSNTPVAPAVGSVQSTEQSSECLNKVKKATRFSTKSEELQYWQIEYFTGKVEIQERKKQLLDIKIRMLLADEKRRAHKNVED